MYRWIRSRAGIFSSRRYPTGIIAQLRRGDIQNVQSVRFVKPPLLQPKRIIRFVGTGIVFYVIYKSVVFGPLSRFLDDLDKNMDDATRMALEEAEDEEKPLFLPVPFTVKEIKSKPYNGDDPEWQEFLKINQDRELGMKIRGDLAERVRFACEKEFNSEQSEQRRLGKFKIRRYWLDVDYPTSPPPTYERSGIEIADNYIAWSTMPVDSLTVSRVRQALWPTPMFKSLWAFVNALATHNLTRVNSVLEREPKPQPNVDALVALQKAQSPKTPADRSSAEEPTIPTTRAPDPRGAPKQPDLINADPAKKTQSIETQSEKPFFSGVEAVKPSFAQIQEHMRPARVAFKQKFASVWHPPQEQPPRGSIRVWGLVEIEAARVFMVVEVGSYWDPKTREYRNMRLQLKRIQPKKQAPRG